MAQSHPTAPQVVDPVESRSELKCDTRDLERSISRLGEIVEVPVNVPRYTTCHTSVVATGKEDDAPGELFWPQGVAIHEETHQIFVANYINHRVEIFSETGDFISQLGVEQLFLPHGVAIHRDSLYVSYLNDHTVIEFSLIEMCHVRRIGGKGSNNGQFNYPRQVTTDLIGRVFIADCDNDRICIHDPDLYHLRNITHPSLSRPEDVHSLFTCGEVDVLGPYFFCLDSLNNFVLSDLRSHSIRVFSPKGNLLHTIGREGHRPGKFSNPQEVAITPNGRLVCVSQNTNYGLLKLY